MSERRKNSAAAGQPEADRPRSPRIRSSSAHHTLLFGLSRHRAKLWWLVAVVASAAAGAGLVLHYTDLTWARTWAGIMGWVDALNPVAVVPLMAVLPVAGFPISVVYLVAGAKFGPLWGGVVVALATAGHLLLTYAIARSFLRAPLQRFIERRHARLPAIPEDEQAAVCLIAALVPGLPYVIRNYLLALAGVRLRYYFWVCLPIYVARSYVSILMGDMSSDPSRRAIIVLLIVDVLKVAICALVIWRLRVHHRRYHAHEHEPDPALPPNAATQ